jgi:hypothetical protein
MNREESTMNTPTKDRITRRTVLGRAAALAGLGALGIAPAMAQQPNKKIVLST